MIDFGVLGPLWVHRDGLTVELRATAVRHVLAVLLCAGGRPVPVSALIDALWPKAPAERPRKAIQVYIHRLRNALGDSESIVHTSAGYAVAIHRRQLDALRFADLATKGRAARREGRTAQASEILARALQLWRGPAFVDVAGPSIVVDEAARLHEMRLVVQEERIAADLDLGLRAELAPELRALIAAYPYREQLRGQLMIALYRADRQAEALQVFRETRALLADELGLEPGPALQRLHERILRADAELAGAVLPASTQPASSALPAIALPSVVPTSVVPASVVATSVVPTTGSERPAPALRPRQLPADVSGFAGRASQLDSLDRLLRGGAPTVLIAVIAGAAGVGKTALAVHWAHRVAGEFPDGQLYLNLRGYATDSPLRPIDALGSLLRALGVAPEQVPIDMSEAAALYRSLLADRRALIVLDNAASPEQVRALLPGAGGSFVLVTSRDRLVGLVALDGARRVDLDVLTESDALTLLGSLLGARRVSAEPDQVAELIALCGRLPLALRIAAANLGYRGEQTVGAFVERFQREDSLALLSVDGDDEAAVQRAFDLTYETMRGPAQRLFRLLGLVPGEHITAAAASVLAGIGVDEAGQLLDRLCGAHLIGQEEADRYGLHDLLRRYARDRCARDDGEEEAAEATRRLYTWYVDTARAASRRLYPQSLLLPRSGSSPVPESSTVPESSAGLGSSAGPESSTVEDSVFADGAQALRWLDAERPNLVSATRHGCLRGPRPMAVLLADALRGYLLRGRHLVDLLSVAGAARAAARAAGDVRGEAAAVCSLASASYGAGRMREAAVRFELAVSLARKAGWAMGEASAQGNLAVIHDNLGELDLAEELYRSSVALHERSGHVGALASTLNNLAINLRQRGRPEEAIEVAGRSLALFESLAAPGGIAVAHDTLGCAHRDLGQLTRASRLLRQALPAHRAIGDRSGEICVSAHLAEVERDLGRLDEALALARSALEMGIEIRDPVGEAAARNAIASTHDRRGDHEKARREYETTVALGREHGLVLQVACGLIGLAEVCLHAGDQVEAMAHAQAGLELTRRTGFGLMEAPALAVLAQIAATAS